jgi:hypothetical protein
MDLKNNNPVDLKTILTFSKMELKDLSDYCIVKKYRDGWLVHPINKKSGNWNCRFIPKFELARMGYLYRSNSPQIEHPPQSSVIVVPSTQTLTTTH